MSNRIFIDRSRIIEFQRCPRRRWLTYHEAGTGIVSAHTPLPLAVGGSVHVGLAVLLCDTQEVLNTAGIETWPIAAIEERAVAAALADFSRHQSKLTLDAGELAAMMPTPAARDFQSQVIVQARELGMDPAQIGQLGSDPAVAQGEFDRYLYAEQAALVEGLVRAYAKRRLRPLLEQFEVLEVEREGEWKLSEWQDFKRGADGPYGEPDGRMVNYELWFMSRPDALLRERQTNELYLLSYKTTATWDVRKARDIEHDMQGLSEGVEVERRLGEWWQLLHAAKAQGQDVSNTIKLVHVFHHPEDRQEGGIFPTCETEDITPAIRNFLLSLPAPPRIHAIRYEHLLKGERWKDKELSARLGIEVRSQKSPLVRQYVAVNTPKKGDGGYRVGDVCVAWDFYRPEDNRDSSLSWSNWKPRPVWEEVQLSRAVNSVPSGIDSSLSCIKDWIDKLDRSELLMSGEDSTVGLAPRELGWKSEAQAMGVTKEHPLDVVFVPPVTIYRNDDQLRDWVEQVEHSERETAIHVAEVNAASDPGEKRHLLNLYFPQHRQSCEYPSTCSYARDRVSVCWGSAEMQADPLAVGGGEYVRRQFNHPQEAQSVDQVPK